MNILMYTTLVKLTVCHTCMKGPFLKSQFISILVLDFSILSQVLSVVSILVKRLILNLGVYAHTQKIPS